MVCGDGEMTMLDMPAKTAQLLADLQTEVPFEVELLPATMARLSRKEPPVAVKSKETVFQVTYAENYGGIVCLIRPDGTDNLLAVSLTHVRVPRSLPFGAAVADYQKHRVKKLRKQQGRRAIRRLM